MIITDISSLHEVSVDVISASEEMEIIRELEKELANSKAAGVIGIGLAAPQIGIKKRVAIVRVANSTIDLVNTKIVSKSTKIISKEGCLSVPGKTIEVERYSDILIENFGFTNVGQFAAFSLPAICIQHEMDHWDGVLMTDKAIMRHTEMGPNLPCPCGSKLKYKKCCYKKTKGE